MSSRLAPYKFYLTKARRNGIPGVFKQKIKLHKKCVKKYKQETF
jgi:hypothetical protein